MKHIKLILIIVSLCLVFLGVGALLASAILKNEDLAIAAGTILTTSSISGIMSKFLKIEEDK